MAGSNKKSLVNTNKWNRERRLEFIDYRLCWNGKINRNDLVTFFGISIPQASLDISKYKEMAGDNIEYDPSSKVYVKGKKFTPLYDACLPENYLNDLLLKHNGILNVNYDFLERTPDIACFSPIKRTIDYNILSTIVFCILNKRAIRINYQSMTRDIPFERLISPHALAFDGIRWHVRAYCHEREQFRDFVVSRILSTGKSSDKSPIDPAEDTSWNLTAIIHIQPKSTLTEIQKKAVELEYNMDPNTHEVIFKCRQALLYYTLRMLKLTPEDEANNTENTIEIKNKNEVYTILNLYKDK